MNKRYLRGNGSNHVEDLKEHSLSDGVVQLSDIERSTLATGGSSLTSGRGRLSGSGSGSGGGPTGRLGSLGGSLGRGSNVRHLF
jgi:hypothetical protein